MSDVPVNSPLKPGVPLRYRQVHLDFHTSPAIADIAAEFDPEAFAATVEKARINSITCFARCHHGLMYFPSKAHPERVHPHLKRPDLLREQIEACHKRNIRVPIYTTVQWDQFSADHHRDWLCLDADGKEYGTPPLAPGFYRYLDVLHPGYRQFLFDHVREVMTTLPVDGFFFDIVDARPSLAIHWKEAMDAAGENPEDAVARQRFARKVINDWMQEMSAFVREFDPDCTIFYNAGHIAPRNRPVHNAFTHYELESLPGGGWGYLHFPQTARYARTLGHDILGMTGKFHTSWGDFGSYKNPAALQFECFHAIAVNARVSVGDQLPPQGRLDAATYELIGSVYSEIEKKEPYCIGAKAVCDVALVTSETPDYHPHGNSEINLNNVLGAVRMLQELRVQFDIVDFENDYSGYRVLILPDDVPADPTFLSRLEAFIAAGGKVLATHKSCENADILPVLSHGEAPYSPDFLVPTEQIGAELPKTGHVMYKKARLVEPKANAEVLARVQIPYFNRTWRHFCSHAHTPSSGEEAYPAAVASENVVYLAHPVFRQYFENAPRWCKVIVADALRRLLPEPVLEVDGPSSLIVTLNRQEAENRFVLHLLHYIPERRGQKFDVVEDIIPLYNLPVRLRLPDAPAVSSVQLVPNGDTLPFTQEGNRISFTVPHLHGHALVSIQ